tara:strand:+ start:1780 stop:1917 length:138 start_codon:yes stop_codon:yes gene_type:complete
MAVKLMLELLAANVCRFKLIVTRLPSWKRLLTSSGTVKLRRVKAV